MISGSGDIVYFHTEDPFVDFSEIGKYETNPDHKKWILSRTKKRLDKLGMRSRISIVNEYRITRIRINSEKLSKIILEMSYNLKKLFFEPHCVIMGCNQLDLLIDENLVESHMYGGFICPVDLCMRDGEELLRIYSIAVSVVPGFDSMLLIPKECITNI